MLHLGGYARGVLYAVRAQHNGHERVRRPTPSGDLGNGKGFSAANMVACGMVCVLIEREMVRARGHVHEHHPIVLDGLVFDRPDRLGRQIAHSTVAYITVLTLHYFSFTLPPPAGCCLECARARVRYTGGACGATSA